MAQLGQRQNDDLKVLVVPGPRHLFGLAWFVESGPEKCAALAAPTDRTSCRGHDSPGSSPGVDCGHCRPHAMSLLSDIGRLCADATHGNEMQMARIQKGSGACCQDILHEVS